GLPALKPAIHGQPAHIHHDGTGIYRYLPSPMQVGCYQSHTFDESAISSVWNITARNADGSAMSLRHRELRTEVLLFRPEALLTQYGRELTQNFLTAEHGQQRPT